MVAAAALIDPAGQVLMSCRTAGKDYAGYWEFPGGKLEPNEPPEFALMRELREELGIETRPTCFYPVGFVSHQAQKNNGQTVGYVILLYACRMWRGVPSSNEGQELKWIPPKQMYNYQVVPADIPLIAQVIDRI
jgi:8-oxo-dGTP diphosphatase